ncbi:MAG: aspartate kinase [Chloroflexota bacterium]|nr:aspartate kinase [Chloroflexota bacterium]
MSLHVYKFGGTSVGSPAAVEAVARIVGHARTEHQVAIIVSAMSGVTDALLRGAHTAAAGDGSTFGIIAGELIARHGAAAAELVGDADECRALHAATERLLNEFQTLCHGIHVLGELTPRALDTIGALGERLNAPLVAAALRAKGLKAQAIDAATLIRTDDRFGDATPLMAETEAQVNAELRPLLEQGYVPVITGFLGATANGITTTLGRGGSDYSAAVIGASLNADTVIFYKEVDGVLTTDPRVVPEARVLRRLAYDEISELAYFGAKVLHPKTIQPLVEKNIPVHFKNTFNPEHPGTVVMPRGEAGAGAIKAVTAIRNLTMLTVAGRGMLGVPGIAARTFTAVARIHASVLMISQASSEQSICFVIPSKLANDVKQSLEHELANELARRDIDGVFLQDQAVIISVVGAGIRTTPGIAGRIFAALGDVGINIHAIALGSSECSISLVVDANDADTAVRAIHPLTARVETTTPQLV